MVAAGFDFYSFGPGGETVEIRFTEKKRGGKYLYTVAEMRLISKKNAVKLASLDDPDVEGKAGVWEKMPLILGTRATFGFLPDAEESRHLLADRLKPPSLPPREQCVDLYNSIGFIRLGSDGKDYSPTSPNPATPSNPPTPQQVLRTGADPVAMRKALALAVSTEAPESVIHLNEGGHYVYTSDFRTHDAISATYMSDMIPVELALQGIRDVMATGKWFLPTSLSIQLQFYSKPSSPIMRRALIGGAHLSEQETGLSDTEVLLWDDRTEQLILSGRQIFHMIAIPGDDVVGLIKEIAAKNAKKEREGVGARL